MIGKRIVKLYKDESHPYIFHKWVVVDECVRAIIEDIYGRIFVVNTSDVEFYNHTHKEPTKTGFQITCNKCGFTGGSRLFMLTLQNKKSGYSIHLRCPKCQESWPG